MSWKIVVCTEENVEEVAAESGLSVDDLKEALAIAAQNGRDHIKVQVGSQWE